MIQTRKITGYNEDIETGYKHFPKPFEAESSVSTLVDRLMEHTAKLEHRILELGASVRQNPTGDEGARPCRSGIAGKLQDSIDNCELMNKELDALTQYLIG